MQRTGGPEPYFICRSGRRAVYGLVTLPPMRVRIDPEPDRPTCVRVVMSELTWATIKSDTKATALFWASALDYPEGLHHLFAEDYRRAARRYAGDLPSQDWFADLDAD